MTQIFIKLLNMSISASWLVLAVLLFRLCLKKAPKWITCLLWAIVALRLVMPFTIESGISLIPSAEVIPQDIVSSQAPAIHSGIPALNSTVNPAMTQQVMQEENVLEEVLKVASAVWTVGAVSMILYGIISCLLLHRRVKASILLRENIYICDNIDSPFVFGFFRPRIYIPSGMEDGQLSYVLSHEKAHIRRGDHCWKPLSFWLLTAYWFNPLLWLAYILVCRDIERACDEKVIAQMCTEDKKGYSQALVACSVHRRMIMACPVAFGEIGIRERVKGVLSYKKPAFWIIAAALAVCLVTGICFLTNPETCTPRGLENRTCPLCKHSYTVPVEVCEHSYDDGVVTQGATCIEQGMLERTCAGCGVKKTEAIEMTAHIDGEHIISKEPHCTQKGEVTTTCTYCQAVYVVEILPENDVHDFVETVITESTCTKNGEGIKKCNRCDYSETVSYDMKEHNYKKYLSIAPACTTTGHNSWLCTDCGYIEVETLPKDPNNHQFNMSETYCDRCGVYLGGVRIFLPDEDDYVNHSSSRSDNDPFNDYSGNINTNPKVPVINIDDPFGDKWVTLP